MPRLSPQYSLLVKIGPNRIEKVHLAYMAALLREHGTRKRILRDLESQIIQSTPEDDNRGMPRATGVSNPVDGAMGRLDNHKEPSFGARARLRMMIRTVEEVHAALPRAQREIIGEVYMKRERTVIGMASVLGIGQATAYRERNKALLAFAVALIGEEILLPPAAR